MPEVNTKKGKLLSLKTNFRTLKYSGDQPFDGTSPQPYIQTPLAKDWNAEVNTTGYLDTVKAGASIDLFDKAKTGVGAFLGLRQDIDKVRVNTFLQNNQKGKAFTTNQRSLQFQNPKMEVGTTLNISPIETKNNSILEEVWGRLINSNGALEYTRVYNDNQNLLQQVGVSGTGNHYDRAGTYPVTPFNLKYFHTVKTKDKNRNRLVLLLNSKVDTTDYRATLGVSTTAELVKLGITRDQNTLFNYLGGPTSTQQINSTFIQRYDFTNTWNNFDLYSKGTEYDPTVGFIKSFIKPKKGTLVENEDPNTAVTLEDVQVVQRGLKIEPGTPLGPMRSGPDYNPSANQTLYNRAYETTFQVENYTEDVDGEIGTTSALNRPSALTYSEMLKKTSHAGLTAPGIKPDFRATIPDIPSTDRYEGYAGEGYLSRTYHVGSPGNKYIDRSDYKSVGYGNNDAGVDKVNATDIIQTETDSGGIDLIKCIIRPVESGKMFGKTLVHESILVFRAFLTNFTDNINASYAEHTYIGRGEKFYTYQTADRKVGFSLAIAAQSRAEMKPLYRKLNYLVSQLYPEYSGLTATAAGNGFMRSPLVKLTIGDYFYNTPGIITSLNITVPDDSPWELESSNMHNGLSATGMLSPYGDMYQLPQYLNLNLQFTPIHNFIPRRATATTVTKNNTADNKNYYIPPFITPHEDSVGSINGKNKFNIG